MNRRELDMLLDDLFEGRLDGADFERLQRELRDNPAAREAYRESLHLEHALRFRSKGVDLLRVVPMERVVERRARRAMRHSLMAAAAVLMLGLLVMALILGRPQVPTLTFTASHGSDLALSHDLAADQIPQGLALEIGSRLAVRSGTVELVFDSGVRGILRGPAEVTLQRADLLDLEHGTAWFEVPRKAVGFQVRTSDLVLTDLGTEFGLISERNFSDEVHVFDGKVEILNRHGLKTWEIIDAGQARAAGPAGHWKEIPLRHDPFLTKLPDDGPAEIHLDDTAVFTTSPENQMIRQGSYTLSSTRELAGFDPSDSDKLVVTLSHERGSIRKVTYGGVRMSPSVQAAHGDLQHTAIFHLDRPGTAGDLVVTFNGFANGVGGSLLALSNTAPGGPAATHSSQSTAARLTAKTGHCFIVASHACNDGPQPYRAEARKPLTPLFDGPTGSSLGGSGYRQAKSASLVTAAFASNGKRPVTVAAVFAPAPAR